MECRCRGLLNICSNTLEQRRVKLRAFPAICREEGRSSSPENEQMKCNTEQDSNKKKLHLSRNSTIQGQTRETGVGGMGEGKGGVGGHHLDQLLVACLSGWLARVAATAAVYLL